MGKIQNLAQKVISLFAAGSLVLTVSCSDGIKTDSKVKGGRNEGVYAKIPWSTLWADVLVYKTYPYILEVDIQNIQKLHDYWQPKLQEGPIPVMNLWIRGPEDLQGAALYVGAERIFSGAKRIYDAEGNLYYASPYTSYEGFLTEDEYSIKEKQKLEQSISEIKSVWLGKLKEKTLTTHEMVEAIPGDLVWIQQKIGINGILAEYEGIKRYDIEGKTFYCLTR